MIGFVIFFVLGFGGSIVVLLRSKKSVKELSLFIGLSLLGFIVWMSIFLDRKLNPNQWIAALINWTGL